MKREELLTIEQRWLQSGSTKEKFEQEVSFAWQAYNANPLLQKCTKESLMASVYNVALTSLSLNPVLKHAALVPRWNSKEGGYEASLEPQYQGLIHLAIKSGTVKAIVANVVYDGDDLDMDYAVLRKVIKHVPYIITGKDKGEIKAVYSIALMTDGVEIGEVMSFAEVKDIRDRSESYKAYAAGKIKNTVWVTDLGEMCRKTVVKRQIKYLSKGKNENLQQAVELDNQIHGFRPLVDVNQVEYLTHLIEEELIVDDSTLNMLRMKLSGLIFKDEASDLISHIFDNYIQPAINKTQKQISDDVMKKVDSPNT